MVIGVDTGMQAVLSALVGVGLAASCGFRVFVPLLVLNLAAQAGVVALAPGVAFLGSWPATVALSIGTVLEVAGYLVPWLDHALDVVATPAAVVAGSLAAASQFGPVTEWVGAGGDLLKWSAAIIAGGGLAATVQAGTVATRVTSTATTGGAGNPIVSAGESAAAVVTATLSVLMPILVGAVMLLLAGGLAWWWLRRRGRNAAGESPSLAPADGPADNPA